MWMLQAGFCGFLLVATASPATSETIDLSTLESPILIQGCDRYSYRDPHMMYHDGWFHLWMTVNEPRKEGRSMASFLGQTRSRDLRHWEPVQIISPENPQWNYSSPGNVIRDGDRWHLCFQSYPIPGDGFIGDSTARLFIMHSEDLTNWSQPELLPVKGPDVPVEKMGRMIDPYLFEDKDEPGKWWCTYKQHGVSMSWTRDFQNWRYHGRTDAGENVCVWIEDDQYMIMHSPPNGMGIKRSRDMVVFADVLDGRAITLGQKHWPWAARRLTAGEVVNLKGEPRVGKYLLVFHGSAEIPNRHEHLSRCSIGIAWSDDLVNWQWPGIR